MPSCELCNCPLTVLRTGPRSQEHRTKCARCDPENKQAFERPASKPKEKKPTLMIEAALKPKRNAKKDLH